MNAGAATKGNEPVQEHSAQTESKAQTENCVLVGEDNPMNQRVMGAFLKSLGIEYEIAENGQEVIDRLREADYALVLMDIQMPILDGMSAIRLIRAGAVPRKDIPIVVVTANAMQGDRDAYMGGGADDYLSKPITLDALKTALRPYAVLKDE